MIKNPDTKNAINKLLDLVTHRKSKTVYFTSATPKEGVTTIACVTAEIATAQYEKILFCDFTNYSSSLSKQHDIKFQETKGDHIEQIYANIYFIEKLGFYLLPPATPLIGTLMRNEVLRDLIHLLKKQYDLIIMDGNNFNEYEANAFSPRTLCEVADSTVLVVLTGGITESKVNETVANISRNGGNLIGIIMNDVNYPRLVDELCRETNRLEKRFPKIAKSLRHWLGKSPFFNIEN